MAISTIRTRLPQYQDVYRSRYGISGPSFLAPGSWFTSVEGPTYQFEQSPVGGSKGLPQYPTVGPAIDTPSLGEALASLVATSVAKDMGERAGQATFAAEQAGQPISLLDSLGEGASGTWDAATDTLVNLPDTISDSISSLSEFISPTQLVTPSYSPSVFEGPGHPGISDYASTTVGSTPTPVATDTSGSIATGTGTGYMAKPFWAEGSSVGGNLQYGGFQSGLLSGFATAGMALLTGSSPKKALVSGVDSGLGTAAGYALGGPIGGLVGGFVGNMFRVICTELNKQGRLSNEELRAEEWYTLRKIHPWVIRGYHIWAIPYVRIMQRSEKFSDFSEWWAGARAQEILYQCGKRSKPHYGGKVVRAIVEPVCFVIGGFAHLFDIPELEWRNAG